MTPACQSHIEKLLCLRKNDLAERLKKNRKLFARQVLAVDIHTHSTFSDGVGTVKQNRSEVNRVGLDFFFATDHHSIAQKRSVKNWPEASWGQEPPMGRHHVGLLCNSKLFKPDDTDPKSNFAAAKQIAPFAWIPHPVGWYPWVRYPDEAIDALWTLGDKFAMEIMNGANKITRAYDDFDAKAVRIWDRLLCDGRKVTALGGSDAHNPNAIGIVWTGVFAPRKTAPSIIKTLNQGNCFASEAPVISLTCDDKPMGSTTHKPKGSNLKFNIRIADSTGIASVRLVSGGKTIKTLNPDGKELFIAELSVKSKAKPTYYRLECTARDDRRAFTSPIYVEPHRIRK